MVHCAVHPQLAPLERFNMNKAFRVVKQGANFLKQNRTPIVLGLIAAPLLSHAAIDVTDATTGVSDAKTAVTTVLGAMIGMSAAVYGLRKVLRLLGR